MYIRCSASHSMQLIISAFMHQSVPPVPSPPWATAGICPPCQSRGWGICKFCTARGPGICQPWAIPELMTRTRSPISIIITTQKVLLEKKHIGSSVKDRNKLTRGVKACSQFYACISSLSIKPELHSEISVDII